MVGGWGGVCVMGGWVVSEVSAGVTSVAGTSTELRTVEKGLIPRKNQKERPKSFADIERTLAKLAKLLSHRRTPR